MRGDECLWAQRQWKTGGTGNCLTAAGQPPTTTCPASTANHHRLASHCASQEQNATGTIQKEGARSLPYRLTAALLPALSL